LSTSAIVLSNKPLNLVSSSIGNGSKAFDMRSKILSQLIAVAVGGVFIIEAMFADVVVMAHFREVYL
jgi:hypothetical protein